MMTNWKENALICVKYYYATSFSTFSFFGKLSTILPNYWQLSHLVAALLKTVEYFNIPNTYTNIWNLGARLIRLLDIIDLFENYYKGQDLFWKVLLGLMHLWQVSHFEMRLTYLGLTVTNLWAFWNSKSNLAETQPLGYRNNASLLPPASFIHTCTWNWHR